jgi:hypothetical protein
MIYSIFIRLGLLQNGLKKFISFSARVATWLDSMFGMGFASPFHVVGMILAMVFMATARYFVF